MKHFFLLAPFWFGISIGSHAQSRVYQSGIYKLHPGNEAHFHESIRVLYESTHMSISLVQQKAFAMRTKLRERTRPSIFKLFFG
jgi:hypothetical protein